MKLLLWLVSGFLSFGFVQPESFTGALAWLFLAWPVATLICWLPFLGIAALIGAEKRKREGL